MKQLQQGFIVPLVIIIVAALTIGGGVYYHEQKKQTQVPVVETKTQADIEIQKETPEQSKKKVVKPVVLSFEAKARAAAQKGECGKYGTIGTATKVQAEYEYALFNIDNSDKVNYCAVDLYAGTTVALSTKPLCDSNGQNCHGTGALPTPKKQYEQIPVAH